MLLALTPAFPPGYPFALLRIFTYVSLTNSSPRRPYLSPCVFYELLHLLRFSTCMLLAISLHLSLPHSLHFDAFSPKSLLSVLGPMRPYFSPCVFYDFLHLFTFCTFMLLAVTPAFPPATLFALWCLFPKVIIIIIVLCETLFLPLCVLWILHLFTLCTFMLQV